MRDEGNRKRSVRFRLVLMVASLTAAVFLMVSDDGKTWFETSADAVRYQAP